MKIKILSISIVVGGLLLSGCQSTSVDSNTTFSKPGSTILGSDKEEMGEAVPSVEPLKYYNKIARARIPLQIVVSNSNDDFYKTEKSIAGNIANMGFEITDSKPFLTVAVENGDLKLFDKYGNYYVYKAIADITIHRNISDYEKTQKGAFRLLANERFIVKGERRLNSNEAAHNASEKLSKEASTWVDNVCKREMVGIKGEKVELNIKMLKVAFAGFFNNPNSFESCMSKTYEKIVSKPGVLYCIETGRTPKSVAVDVLYNKKKYPNGLFKPSVMSDVTFYAKSLDERVDELLGYLIR